MSLTPTLGKSGRFAKVSKNQGYPIQMNSYEKTVQVEARHIDGYGHVNNIEYVKWMQEVALAHADAVGYTEASRRDGTAWFAREHQVKYLRQAFEGDIIRMKTWIEGFRRASCLRKYQFIHEKDGKVLAEGSTEWVFVDSKSGRVLSIPENIKKSFERAIIG